MIGNTFSPRGRLEKSGAMLSLNSSTVIGWPAASIHDMESAIDSMPSVTMNGGIFVRDTTNPLRRPATAAAATAAIVPPTMPKIERKKTIAEIDIATSDPTDKSNPPLITTSACPNETSAKAGV